MPERAEAMAMQVETNEPEIIERVAALDIGKAEVVCCIPGARPARAADAGGPHGHPRTLGEDTLHRCRRVLSPDHPITLWAATGLTLALSLLGEAEPARTLGEDTLQRCRRVLGTEHPIMLHLTRATSRGHPLISDDAVADHADGLL